MRYRRRETPPIELNLTSLMDVAFQLIIFFILVNNFAAGDMPALDPPDPHGSQAQPINQPVVRVVNVLPDPDRPGMAHHVRIAGQNVPMQELTTLTELLQRERRAAPDVQVSLRVDRSIRYDQVQPVLRAITAAEVQRVNLVAMIERVR